MPTLAGMQIPPPSSWDEFENICRDLWAAIWKDPNTQKNGRQGQSQNGVDVYGRPNQKKKLNGVQCKGKDNFSNKTLTKKELLEEIKKAKKFKPAISEYLIATTVNRDNKIQELARKITDKHLKKRLFSVSVVAWPDIVNLLTSHEDILRKHYPQLFFKDNPTVDKNQQNQTTQTELKETLGIINSKLSQLITPSDSKNSDITYEHQAELDNARDLLENNKPQTALDILVKLKNRVWDSTIPIVRFRLLTNIAAAKLDLGQEKEAARLFIEALQYNPKDEKALLNVSLANLTLENYVEAEKYINQVLKKNPASERAYSSLIHLLSEKKNQQLDLIIKRIPKSYQKLPQVAFSLALTARKNSDEEKARFWYEVALEKNKNKLPGITISCAGFLVSTIAKDKSVIYADKLNKKQEMDLNKAVNLYSKGWEKIKDSEINDLKIECLVNRSVCYKLLGNLKEASKDLDTALTLEPNNNSFIFNRARIYQETRDRQNAINLLKKIPSNTIDPPAPLLLAELLWEEKRPKEAIPIIESFIKIHIPKNLKAAASRLLTEIYISVKNFNSALELAKTLVASDQNSILNLICYARVLRFTGNEDDSSKQLEKAKALLTKSSAFEDKLSVADECYYKKDFKTAADLYQQIVDINTNNFITRRLLKSYYFSGNEGEALKVCEALRKNNGPIRSVTEIESSIYEVIGNLKKAKEVCELHLKSYPDDLEIKVRLGMINFRSRNLKAVDRFLKENTNYHDLSLQSCIQYIQLLSLRGFDKEALDAIYETRRKFYNESDAHLQYIGIFLHRDKDEDKLLDNRKVAINTAVYVEDPPGIKTWYIIENRKDADLSKRELNEDNALSKKLIGLKVGDKVNIVTSGPQKRLGKILEIKSKYVYALHESTSSFQTLFPNAEGFYLINLKIPKGNKDPHKELKPIFDQIDKQHEKYQKVTDLYLTGKITVGVFSRLIGRNAIEGWGLLINRPELGLHCSSGNPQERVLALNLIQQGKKKLIIDIISLLTIHGINLADEVIKGMGKLGIAQSTVDLLTKIISDRKGIEENGFMTMGKENGKYIREEISAESLKKNTEYLEGILKWIHQNCAIIPCTESLKIETNKKQELDNLFGPSFIDTMLIVKQENGLLFSDDERLRSVAKNTYGIEGIWTQIVLSYLLSKGLITEDQYSEAIVKLVNSHYHHISINAETLVEAAKQSAWKSEQPFTNIVKVLNGGNSDDRSAIRVTSNFIKRLFTQKIYLSDPKYLLFSLLDDFTKNRVNKGALLKRVSVLIRLQFQFLPKQEREINTLINEWIKNNVI